MSEENEKRLVIALEKIADNLEWIADNDMFSRKV